MAPARRSNNSDPGSSPAAPRRRGLFERSSLRRPPPINVSPIQPGPAATPPNLDLSSYTSVDLPPIGHTTQFRPDGSISSLLPNSAEMGGQMLPPEQMIRHHAHSMMDAAMQAAVAVLERRRASSISIAMPSIIEEETDPGYQALFSRVFLNNAAIAGLQVLPAPSVTLSDAPQGADSEAEPSRRSFIV